MRWDGVRTEPPGPDPARIDGRHVRFDERFDVDRRAERAENEADHRPHSLHAHGYCWIEKEKLGTTQKKNNVQLGESHINP